MHLSKHHGLGNDFLVLIDLDGRHEVDAARARALCDRRRGVGADGIIHATAASDGADVSMDLRNADGSWAELSGNGIRCLAHAVLRSGAVAGPRLRVATPGGVRAVELHGDPSDTEVEATVEMGRAVIGEVVESAIAERAVRVMVSNPHVVLLVREPDTAPVHELGHAFDHDTPGGTNVEFLCSEGADKARLRVWERGVGETESCGTGACAAAAALVAWERAASEVRISMPGGEVDVRVEPDGTTWLTGPATWVADVEVADG